MAPKKRVIGILTSGGDAPGMNAAIRAVVRTAEYLEMKVIGIKKGYNGLIASEFTVLDARSVSETIHRGGTILLTARSSEMMTLDGQIKAANICRALNIDCLIIIGGDGSMRGARDLAAQGIDTICIPATIDLDLNCSEYTIGFDTAVNTAMDAINKIRDTSSSHERCSVVEVMGRDAGYLALWCGITGGAEEVIIPEMHRDQNFDELKDEIVSVVLQNRQKGKTHNLIIVAEGMGGSAEIAEHIQKITGIDSRATILGHLQRGGSPTALDRMHASMMGNMAVKLINEGKKNRVVAFQKGEYVDFALEDAINMEKHVSLEMVETVRVLSV